MTACLLEWKKVKVTQSCPTLCDPMDCSRPEYWSGVPSSRGSFQPRDWTQSPALQAILHQLSHHREGFQRVHSNLILVLDTTCWCLVVKSYLTLCDSMNRSPPGSSVHGISHERMLGCVAISSSRGSSQPRDQTCISGISCIAGGFFTYRCARGEAQHDVCEELTAVETSLQWKTIHSCSFVSLFISPGHCAGHCKILWNVLFLTYF